jgi:hypothetical protein
MFGIAMPLWAEVNTFEDEQTNHWLEDSQQAISHTIQLIGSGIDDFISRDFSINENESFVRLRASQTFYSAQDPHFEPQIHAKLDLAKTKDRFKLFFENTSDDLESLLSQNQENQTNQAPDKKNDSVAGFRWIAPFWSEWRPSTDIGVRTSIPLDTFIRFRIRRTVALGEHWKFHTSHQLAHYHYRGTIAKSQFTFGLPIQNNLLWLNSFEFQWHKIDRRVEGDVITSLTHSISPKDTIVWRVGAFYMINPYTHPSNYLIDMRYRRQLKWQWLYAELVPGINWSEERDYRQQFSITARLEVLFKQF